MIINNTADIFVSVYEGTIHRILALPKENQDILFKPVQMSVLRKIAENRPLSENEKRYLRGRLGEKLSTLDLLINGQSSSNQEPWMTYVSGLRHYYIAGHMALKLNGFGWFFEPRTVIVVNTHLKGRIHPQNKVIEYVRIRSISEDQWHLDEDTGIRISTNTQVFHDAQRLGDESLLRTWWSMYDRYGSMFVEDAPDFDDNRDHVNETSDVSEYGV
jgi:hypothetical protein